MSSRGIGLSTRGTGQKQMPAHGLAALPDDGGDSNGGDADGSNRQSAMILYGRGSEGGADGVHGGERWCRADKLSNLKSNRFDMSERKDMTGRKNMSVRRHASTELEETEATV